MKKNHFAILLPVLALLAGCIQPRQQLDKLWFFTYYTGAAAGRDGELTPASFLNLQQDGRYTSDFGGFEYGTWKSDSHNLILSNNKQQISIIKVEYLSANELRISSDKISAASFEKQAGTFKSSGDNPFSIENNFWRKHAVQKETNEDLRKRLLNHARFWEKYFTWALNSGIASVDVRSTPTSIKIYGNGFALKPFNELPSAWKSYFFDEEDCSKANNIVENIFKTHDIAWAHTDNKYKLFISAFQQMQQLLGR